MRAPGTLEVQPVEEGKDWLKHFTKMSRKIYEQAARAINGRLTFGDGTSPDNMQGKWVNTISLAPGVDQVLTHNLSKVPVGVLVFSKSAACDVSVTTSDATTITIQSSVAGVTLRLFIL